MKKYSTIHLLATVTATGLIGSAASAQLLTWDAGGDGVSVYQEANWTGPDDEPGTDPAADTVNGNLSAAAGPGLVFDFLVGGSATAGGTGGAGPNFDLSDATTLTVRDDATFRMNTGGAPAGIRGGTPFDATTRASVVVEDNATVITQFAVEIDFSLSDASTLEFAGGGNPVNVSTIDLAADWTGELRFLDELTTDVETEHLSKITVNGAAAVVGTNVFLSEFNDGLGALLSLSGAPGLTADLSGDGDVDDEDLGLFFSAFTGPDNGPSLNPAADLSGDGDVDDEDLGQAFSQFTGPLGPASVPEPTSLALLGLGGLLVARRRR